MSYRILIVDDSPVMRLMLQEMLESLGHEIVGQADTAAGAFKTYKELKPDLVTLDISLPDADGLSALREIRKADPFARVLIITGNDQKKLQDQALQLRAAGVLRKPFDVDDLAGQIEKIASSMRRPAA
ncbi:MAG: response regulator [Elusimicrobia bacterium]|nr:response regulator [Elusimicrobiota bacterium]